MTTAVVKWGAICAVAGLALVGCGKKDAEPAAAPAAPAPVVLKPPVPPVSINAVMVEWIDHAGHELWDVERTGKAPKSAADWAIVEEHATQMAAAGALVALGGTGVQDAKNHESPSWQTWSKKLSEAGLAEVAAARARDMEALRTANGQLVEVCEGCHKEFKPAIPSEGLVHTHTH